MAALRQLTPREEAIINKYSAAHGQVRGLDAPIADDTGAISMPLRRVPLLTRLEHKGTISRTEAEAGERFAALFRLATLDTLKAADVLRVPMPPGRSATDISPSAERCRRRVSEIMTLLGGAGSAPASAVWHCVGLEMSVAAWALSTRRRHEFATGILAAGLALLASYFGDRRQRRA